MVISIGVESSVEGSRIVEEEFFGGESWIVELGLAVGLEGDSVDRGGPAVSFRTLRSFANGTSV